MLLTTPPGATKLHAANMELLNSLFDQAGPMVFANAQQVIDYVEREIQLALPEGWTAKRERTRSLVWRIVSDNSGPLQDYGLRVTEDWKLFLIEHGNSDVGPLNLHHALLNAKVIDADALVHFPLSLAIAEVLRHCPPNQWGLT